MREANEMGVTSPFGGVPADNMRGPGMVSRLNPSVRSAASGSARVAHLVRRAMTYFETDRAAAWRCLSDASYLLVTESEESFIQISTLSCALPPGGGLAAWQAKRILAYIEEKLRSKVTLRDLATQVALSVSHFSRVQEQSGILSHGVCRLATNRACKGHDDVHGRTAHGHRACLWVLRPVAFE